MCASALGEPSQPRARDAQRGVKRAQREVIKGPEAWLGRRKWTVPLHAGDCLMLPTLI